MSDEMLSGCTPDKCGGCTGCGGESIEKITIRVEWQHKGAVPESPEEIESAMNDLAAELIVSGVELIYINNTFGKDIPDNSSSFLINGHPLEKLVKNMPSGPVSKDIIRKGIFQALLSNL